MVQKVAFVGAGSMAEAIMAGMINKEFLRHDQIFVTNKENEGRLTELQEKYRIVGLQNKEETLQDAEVVIFATKPYDLETALEDVKQYITKDQLIISVIAGISTDFITEKLAQDVAVIRSMPNTSATIGYSATAVTKGQFATDAHITLAKRLFAAIGTVSVVEEEQMHVVTGISGSGPAYVYYLVEAMERAAVDNGLDATTAKQLITQTIIGAGHMLEHATEPVDVLRNNVTSPNGTTAAGIQTLMEYNFPEAVEQCVTSATRRSIELGKK